jgi:hypothetical protein
MSAPNLLEFSNAHRTCEACKSKRELHLVFGFAKEAGSRPCKVLGAFIPRPLTWWRLKNGDKVTFYPFLVVVETEDGDRSCWLPYGMLWRAAGRSSKNSTDNGHPTSTQANSGACSRRRVRQGFASGARDSVLGRHCWLWAMPALARTVEAGLRVGRRAK